MKLDEVKQVVQTMDVREANKFLAEGFKILKLFSCKTEVNGSEQVQPVYVLGLPSKNG